MPPTWWRPYKLMWTQSEKRGESLLSIILTSHGRLTTITYPKLREPVCLRYSTGILWLTCTESVAGRVTRRYGTRS